MTDLHWRTAAELAAAIGARQLSPVELTDHLLARISAIGPRFDAFLWVDAERARAEARTAEADIATGRYRGPLHGIPVAVKDCIDVAGMPTTCHSAALAGNVATADAAAVSRLRAAGAIVLGKTAMHEFAIDGPDVDLTPPPARNPWNRNHHPGGSSSGSGAAVGAGLLPLAVGTDAGGSIRHPASACGIVGLKPTYDLVSRHGAIPLAPSLDHLGPLARSVADAALMLDALAEPGRPQAVAEGYGHQLGRGLKGLRIGFVRHFHEADAPADDETTLALEEVARVLVAEGAEVSNAVLPPLGEFSVVLRTTLLSEAWAVMGDLVRSRPDTLGAVTRTRLLAGAFLSAGDYINAQRRRSGLIADVEATFSGFDVLLTASSMSAASRIDDNEALQRTYPRSARGPFNVTGHPAIAMIAGISQVSGLPLSVQFVGRYWREATLLRVAHAYERATPWHLERAPGAL